MEQPWVIIVAISPKASDSQSDPSGLAVRADGLKHNKGACIFTDTSSNTCKFLKITSWVISYLPARPSAKPA
jgi:hypothetical protein